MRRDYAILNFSITGVKKKRTVYGVTICKTFEHEEYGVIPDYVQVLNKIKEQFIKGMDEFLDEDDIKISISECIVIPSELFIANCKN